MLLVGNCLISDDIKSVRFACNLDCCKGICCVEGDAGAPLENDEVPILERIFDKIKPYMAPAGIRSVEEHGVAELDEDGEFVTPLVNSQECAYVQFSEDGTAWCAIEKAWKDGIVDFRKPISCHLYPIRINVYEEFDALNYHEWEVCASATRKGDIPLPPLYQLLKEPLMRKYGEGWYAELCEQIEEDQ